MNKDNHMRTNYPTQPDKTDTMNGGFIRNLEFYHKQIFFIQINICTRKLLRTFTVKTAERHKIYSLYSLKLTKKDELLAEFTWRKI